IVPMLQCGLVRSNFSLAILFSPSPEQGLVLRFQGVAGQFRETDRIAGGAFPGWKKLRRIS
ncbi:hypothetical protein, partial [Brevundimonas sp.]|uniref:hypothetical protein n=1 Tax=Brevundimonas sp. TaxID=1871086 RepID=UPI002FD942C1